MEASRASLRARGATKNRADRDVNLGRARVPRILFLDATKYLIDSGACGYVYGADNRGN